MAWLGVARLVPAKLKPHLQLLPRGPPDASTRKVGRRSAFSVHVTKFSAVAPVDCAASQKSNACSAAGDLRPSRARPCS